jgi:hypothetical protein
MPATDPLYRERLHVPLRWWVQATMFLATVWLALIVAVPAWMAWAGSGALLAAVFGLFAWLGATRVEISDGLLYAGPARIPLSQLGSAEALDKDATRRVHGVDADARAFLVTRPYISRAVKVYIEDPDDPTPYWLVSSRHPRRLAAALAGSSHGDDQTGHSPSGSSPLG